MQEHCLFDAGKSSAQQITAAQIFCAAVWLIRCFQNTLLNGQRKNTYPDHNTDPGIPAYCSTSAGTDQTLPPWSDGRTKADLQRPHTVCSGSVP